MSESQTNAVALRLTRTNIMQKSVLILSFIILGISLNTADAQRRTTYQSLLQRSDQPSSYIDHAVLPVSDSTAAALVFFRLDYDFVPFLRARAGMEKPSEDAEYFAPVRMGIEFFEGNVSESGRPNRNSISVFRDFWSDTVWVDSFEQTKSRFDHVEGLLWSQLDDGNYHYELQLGRGDSNRDLPSRRRNLNVPVQSDIQKGSLILASSTSDSDDSFSGNFLNYGDNVLYGEDFDLLIHFPGSADSIKSEYTLQVLKRLPGDSDQTEQTPVFETAVSGENIFYAVFDTTGYDDQNHVRFALRKTGLEDGFAFASLRIPNSEFENAGYRIRILTEGQQEPVAQRDISSRWINMPVSLYNLDVAVDRLSYIANEETIRSLNSGSSSEREQKFRDFWEQRDPTPDTEFNELMTEYYNRIDYAYRNFSSIQTPGYETDQGRAYILFGPPENIERRLPTDGPTREVWTYPDRTLIFEATSGFGDFRLISES
jgi:GWxTD domain-containing protein